MNLQTQSELARIGHDLQIVAAQTLAAASERKRSTKTLTTGDNTDWPWLTRVQQFREYEICPNCALSKKKELQRMGRDKKQRTVHAGGLGSS